MTQNAKYIKNFYKSIRQHNSKCTKDLKRHLTEEKLYIVNKYTRKSSASVIMKIKTTLGYHFMLIRKVKMKKINNAKCYRKYATMKTLICCWWKGKLTTTLEDSLRVS